MNNSVTRYTKTAIILHWLIAIGLIFMFALGWFMSGLPKEGAKSSSYDLFNLGIYTWHMAEEVSPRTFYFNQDQNGCSDGFVQIEIKGARTDLLCHVPGIDT